MWTSGRLREAPAARGVRGAPGGTATIVARSSGAKRPSMKRTIGRTLAWSGSTPDVSRYVRRPTPSGSTAAAT